MPIYHPEPGDDAPATVTRHSYQSFACGLLHYGPIALYCNRRGLQADLEILATERFDVRCFNALNWGRDGSLHDDLMAGLDFPPYYGKNLNALSECLRELDISDDGGMAVVFNDFDEVFRRNPDLARGVLDVFTAGSRLLQIFGKTLLVLVHTKDPDADYGPLGAVKAWWNPREFLRAERGLDQPS